MRNGRPISVLQITPQQRTEPERRVRAGTTSQRDRLRARIVLLRADGMRREDVGREVGPGTTGVNKWSQRFARHGLEGLKDRSGRGRKPSIPLGKVGQVITRAGQAPPGRRRWSSRTMAAEMGIPASGVRRIRRDNNLKPHPRRTFKPSNDKQFEGKFRDVIGPYPNPPDKAPVPCCDEKTRCRALERTQPGLPLGIGHIRTHTHDHIRHGTITLFAAPDYPDGGIAGRTEGKHTHVERLRLPGQIDRGTLKGPDIHPIADNHRTHKHGKVRAWLGGIRVSTCISLPPAVHG